jgi:hypothetical protein
MMAFLHPFSADPPAGGLFAMRTPIFQIDPFQGSRRGGEIILRLIRDRIELEGTCVFYLEGFVEI